MVDIPNWLIAAGTVIGVVVSWWVGKSSARAESERYSREQSKEKEEFKSDFKSFKDLTCFKLDQLWFKVDALWTSQGRRGATAAVIQGLGEVHSPLRATPKGRQIFAPIIPDVDNWYRDEGHGLDEAMLRAKIEARFGERIMKDFCIPNGYMQSECIEIVVAIVREDYEKETRTAGMICA